MAKADFWDLILPVFTNKRTGQMSVVLPKKKLKGKVKYVTLRVGRWNEKWQQEKLKGEEGVDLKEGKPQKQPEEKLEGGENKW